MRRNDREITEETEIRKVLDECKIVHLGFQDGGRVFVVPVNYGYSYEGGKLTVYFHGADAGLKRELAESNPVIGFEIDNGGDMGRAESLRLHGVLPQHHRERTGVGGKRQGREEKDPYDFHGVPG